LCENFLRGFISVSIERVFVQPTTESARQFKTPLRGSDSGFIFVLDVPIAFVFPNVQLSPDVLRRALAKTLDLFAPAASRIVRENGNFFFSDLAFSCQDSPGAVFEFEQYAGDMPSEKAHANQWSRHFTESTFRFLSEPIGIPLFTARLTHFADGGSVLAVTIAHALADGSAIISFLQTWSHLCGLEANAEIVLPREMPIPPVIYRPLKINGLPNKKDSRDLHNRFHTVRGGARALVMNTTDAVVDFYLSKNDLAEFKRKLSEDIPKPEWISSYEALMSALLRALATSERRGEMTCRAMINIRGRSHAAPLGYFGNAITFHRFKLKNQGSVSETALAFHNSLRAALDDPDGLDQPHFAAERYLQKGAFRNMLDRSRWVTFLTSLLYCHPIVNSWVGFDWFDLDFGTGGIQPSYMRVAPSFRHRRHIHVFPASRDGEVMIRMQLSNKTMNRFREALKDMGLSAIFKEVT
jgi:shikimate O-hydroxycinnamoyltransferase